MVTRDQRMIWHGEQEGVTLAGSRDARARTAPCTGAKFRWVVGNAAALPCSNGTMGALRGHPWAAELVLADRPRG